MNTLSPAFAAALDAIPVAVALRVGVLLVVGFLGARLVGRLVARTLDAHVGPQAAMLVRRGLPALVWVVVLMTVLEELGFDLKVLLGAAGVFTVAVGFASQTAASNLISGLFLLAERPFVVGDTITVDSVTGEVLSIDLLSVQLRTADNLYVRVPSEALIKGRIANLSFFPIRRLDLTLLLDHGEDLARVRALLLEAAAAVTVSLDEPPAAVTVQGFRPEGLELQFSVWASRDHVLTLRNTLSVEIKRVFDREGVRVAGSRRSPGVSEALPGRAERSDDDPARRGGA